MLFSDILINSMLCSTSMLIAASYNVFNIESAYDYMT